MARGPQQVETGDNAAVIRDRLAVRRASVAVALAVVAVGVAPRLALAHGSGVPPAPEAGSFLFDWSFDPLVWLPAIATLLVWRYGVRKVAREHPAHPIARHRTVSWTLGVVALLVALDSGIERYDTTLFSVHMVQHMLLELVVAPLLLAAAPITLTLRASSPRVRRGLLVILHSPVLKVISFPVIAWILFAAVNWGWHFSTLYDQALEQPLLHYVQHATFLAAALLFWWPAIGADPSPWRLPFPVRLFYLFLAMPQNSFLGVALLQSSTVLYPHYVTNLRSWGPSPLEDQQLGGMIMWVFGDMAFLVGMAVVVWLWSRNEDRRTARLDRRLAAERAARGEEPWEPSRSRPG